MKVIGLFRELGREIDPSVNSIHDAVGLLPRHSVAGVLKYLNSGVPVFDVMGVTRDPLDHSAFISGGPSLVSDGVWIWRHDLAYFVEKYQVWLPEEFVTRALQLGTVSVDPNEVIVQIRQIHVDYDLAEAGKPTGETKCLSGDLGIHRP